MEGLRVDEVRGTEASQLVSNIYTCNGAVQSCILYNKRSGGG